MAPTVISGVNATASSAHGAHHGQDNLVVSSHVAMRPKALAERGGSVERIPDVTLG